MAIRPFPKKVRVPRKTVVFPSTCPHCLRPASESIPIESKGVLTGWYLFYTKWKYSVIRVPFCRRFARRFWISHRIWNIALIATLILALAVGFLASSHDRGSGLLLFIVIMGPASIPLWLNRPDRHIRLLAADAASIQFAVQEPAYAEELAAQNGTTVAEWYD
jgi:hypothetical protein